MPEVTVALLGPLSLQVDGVEVPLASAKQAAILAVLAVESGRSVAAERLVELVWGEDASERAEHALQQQVSTLRKVLEPRRAPRQESSVLVTRRHGYELVATVDVVEFERRADEASGVALDRDGQDALASIDAALGLWRGPALADLRTSTWADAVAARLEERRLSLCERRVDVLLSMGRHAEVVPGVEELLAQHPFREASWGQLMLALYRSGRQADAVAAFGRARAALVGELGLEPGPELRDLERRVLDQDPGLLAPDRPGVGPLDVAETYRPGGAAVAVLQLPDGQLVRLVDGANCLGRAADAQVRLSDARVSRRHASVELHAGAAAVVDLESTNGTTVGGDRLAPGERRTLRDGDVIGLGGVELVYRDSC